MYSATTNINHKGSIPMVPLKEIKPKSATMKKKSNKFNIIAAGLEIHILK